MYIRVLGPGDRRFIRRDESRTTESALQCILGTCRPTTVSYSSTFARFFGWTLILILILILKDSIEVCLETVDKQQEIRGMHDCTKCNWTWKLWRSLLGNYTSVL